MDKGYRELPHTADVALEVWGRDLPELFANAARGLFGLATSIEAEAPVTAQREIRLSAHDLETLLVDWLSELLLLYEAQREAYVTFEVSLLGPCQLTARLGATQAFSPRRDIKAVTFHNLAIRQAAPGYRTAIVFDV